MSVLIKGIEMPAMPETIKQGEAVPYIDVRIFADGVTITSKGERPYYTQYNAVSVPPHGRLIDADSLASEMEKQISNQDELMELCKSAGDTKNYFNISKVQIGMVSFLRALNDSSTVIPADKEGER